MSARTSVSPIQIARFGEPANFPAAVFRRVVLDVSPIGMGSNFGSALFVILLVLVILLFNRLVAFVIHV